MVDYKLQCTFPSSASRFHLHSNMVDYKPKLKVVERLARDNLHSNMVDYKLWERIQDSEILTIYIPIW